MAEPYCDFHDMPRNQCPHAAQGSEKEALAASGVRAGTLAHTRLDLEADGPTIAATQRSPCSGCGGWIELDESITHTPEGWVHTDEVTFPDQAPPTPSNLFEGMD